MPAGKESGDSSSSNPAHRTTFRPPWVKEGPNPSPTPAAPWALNKATRRDSNSASSTENNNSDHNPLAEVQLRKIKVKSKEPQEPEEREKKNKILASVQLRKTKVKEKEPQENGAKETFFEKPTLKHVPQKEKTPPKKDYKLHNLPTLQKASERVLKSPPKRQSTLKYDSDTDSDDDDDDDDDDEYSDVEIDKEVPQKRNALVREASMRRISQSNIPAPPPQPGMPPPPPKMPGEVPKKLLNDKQKVRIEKLKSRPKVRPDWGNLLQEIEAKKKLKHVVCNDRSSPLLPEAKTPDEHFLYKSEEPNVLNELLRQIEGGIKLKRVKTNDRSKPMLDGLRKFRRQMTIEEQIQKSMSMASIAPEEIAVDEIDEMDDIDKVRDDLQSTKQMLALELRNKEAQERENKRLLARIQNLEAELEKERNRIREAGGGGGGGATTDDKVLSALRKEAEGARKLSQEVEKKYSQTAEELDKAKSQLDDLRRQNQMLEKRLQEAVCGKRLSISDRTNSIKENSEEEVEDSDVDSEGEDSPEKREKRMQKQLKQLRKKLQNFKNKEDNAKKERIALRDIIKKHQAAIKEEKKKYKQLKKEVDKMAALMKDVDEDEEDSEAEEKDPEEETEEEEEEEEEESSEEESDSDSDDESGSERSQSEDEDAPAEKQEGNLTARVKRHENILNALKKGNFLLKTNAERLQDDLNKQKEMTASLQEDLDSVLSELG